MACMGKTIEMSPDGAHSSRNCSVEECAPPRDVAMVHSLLHTRHTCPCEFHSGYRPLVHKITLNFPALHRLTITCISSFCVVHAFLARAANEKKNESVVKTSNYISAKFQHPSCNTNAEKILRYFPFNPYIIFKRLFIVVNARMSNKSGLQIKGLNAHITFKRFLNVVNTQMSNNITFIRK